MKKLFSLLLVLTLVCSVPAPTAFADSKLSQYSDDEIRQLYELVRQEMISRGLALTQEMTLREGKYIVGEDIQPGTYTLKCTETSGETYGGMYSSFGDFYGGIDSALGGLMGSVGDMMGELINAEVKIIGDYGTVLKSWELKAGDSIKITLSEKTALQISEGTCVLAAD